MNRRRLAQPSKKMGQTGVLKVEYEKISTRNWNPNRPLPAAVVRLSAFPLMGFVAWLGSAVYLAGMDFSHQILAAGSIAMTLVIAFYCFRNSKFLP